MLSPVAAAPSPPSRPKQAVPERQQPSVIAQRLKGVVVDDDGAVAARPPPPALDLGHARWSSDARPAAATDRLWIIVFEHIASTGALSMADRAATPFVCREWRRLARSFSVFDFLLPPAACLSTMLVTVGELAPDLTAPESNPRQEKTSAVWFYTGKITHTRGPRQVAKAVWTSTVAGSLRGASVVRCPNGLSIAVSAGRRRGVVAVLFNRSSIIAVTAHPMPAVKWDGDILSFLFACSRFGAAMPTSWCDTFAAGAVLAAVATAAHQGGAPLTSRARAAVTELVERFAAAAEPRKPSRPQLLDSPQSRLAEGVSAVDAEAQTATASLLRAGVELREALTEQAGALLRTFPASTDVERTYTHAELVQQLRALNQRHVMLKDQQAAATAALAAFRTALRTHTDRLPRQRQRQEMMLELEAAVASRSAGLSTCLHDASELRSACAAWEERVEQRLALVHTAALGAVDVHCARQRVAQTESALGRAPGTAAELRGPLQAARPLHTAEELTVDWCRVGKRHVTKLLSDYGEASDSRRQVALDHDEPPFSPRRWGQSRGRHGQGSSADVDGGWHCVLTWHASLTETLFEVLVRDGRLMRGALWYFAATFEHLLGSGHGSSGLEWMGVAAARTWGCRLKNMLVGTAARLTEACRPLLLQSEDAETRRWWEYALDRMIDRLESCTVHEAESASPRCSSPVPRELCVPKPTPLRRRHFC